MTAKLEVCPRCGNQQKLEKTSFCTKCGRAIGDVKEMLFPVLSESNKQKDKNLWEMLFPELGETDENKKLWTIVSQGLGLIIFGIVLALILELLQDFNIIPKVFVKIAFIGFLVAGILQMGIHFFSVKIYCRVKKRLRLKMMEQQRPRQTKILMKNLCRKPNIVLRWILKQQNLIQTN